MNNITWQQKAGLIFAALFLVGMGFCLGKFIDYNFADYFHIPPLEYPTPTIPQMPDNPI